MHARAKSQAFQRNSPEPCKLRYLKPGETHALLRDSEFFTDDKLSYCSVAGEAPAHYRRGSVSQRSLRQAGRSDLRHLLSYLLDRVPDTIQSIEGEFMPEDRSESIKTARLSKNIWLKHTLGKIGDVGVAAIQIESLARELKVTKGSFYWHFKDRDSLLSETLKYWYNSATIAIGLAGKRDFNAPRDRLRYFFTLALNKGPDVPGGPIEQALREWARVSDIAAETTKRVDQDRMSLIAEAYIELGQSRNRARQTAAMALAHLIGLNILMPSKKFQHQSEDKNAFMELFIPDYFKEHIINS